MGNRRRRSGVLLGVLALALAGQCERRGVVYSAIMHHLFSDAARYATGNVFRDKGGYRSPIVNIAP